MIDGWCNYTVPQSPPSGKYRLPEQSRQTPTVAKAGHALSLRVLVAEQFLQSTLRSSH